jgi:hypothetical protein
MANLKVGDKVMWRGSWGKDIAKKTTVTDIDVWNGTDLENAKEADWELVSGGREVVVSLSNGFWAYGFQLSKV